MTGLLSGAISSSRAIGELAIDVAVMPPVFGAEHRPRVGDVAERPDSFVGESIIEAALLFRREPDAPQRVLRMVGRHADMVERVHCLAVRVAGALRDPGAVAGAQNRLHRGDQAAGGHDAFDAARPVLMFVGLAIGDREEARAPQPPFDENLEPLGGPRGLRRISQSRLFLRGGARRSKTGGELRHLTGQRFELAGWRDGGGTLT